MAGSINKVVLVGRVGRDPEMRSTQDGKRIANLSIATSETWKDRSSGERKERTEWHRVVIFNEHLSEIAEKYVHKGSLIGVEGQLQTRKWTDQQGVERYSTEVVLSNFKGEITLLSDGSSGGGRREPGDGGGDDPGGFGGGASRSTGGGSYSQRRDPPRSGGGGAGGGRGDLDDEIPFARNDLDDGPARKRAIL